MTRRCLLAALLLCAAAPAARGQISPASRARTFLKIFSRGDASGKALAFDVLAPADHPTVLSACFRALRSEHPLVVTAAASFLEGATEGEALDHLLEEGPGHRRRPVRVAVARALAARSDEATLAALGTLAADDDWLVRACAARALGLRRASGAAERLSALARDRDPRVRMAALDGLGALQDLQGAAAVVGCLSDEAWPVRAAAIAAAREMRPRSAMEPLMDRMDAEQGRLRMEAYKALVWLAGRDLGEDPSVWRAWWAGQARRHGTEGRMEREYEEYAITRRTSVPRKFFRVKTDSRRLVFVLDLSESMNSFSKPFRPEDPSRTRTGPPTRYTVLLDELLRTVQGFDENVHFNIILFGSEVHAWKDGLARATARARTDAISFVRARQPRGDTNVFDALARAFGISERALATGRDYFDQAAGLNREKDFENGPDTVFLLSDGVPNRGAITEPDRIAEEITRLNRYRRVVIHTIAVGRFSADFLRVLAVDNGGFASSLGD